MILQLRSMTLKNQDFTQDKKTEEKSRRRNWREKVKGRLNSKQNPLKDPVAVNYLKKREGRERERWSRE